MEKSLSLLLPPSPHSTVALHNFQFEQINVSPVLLSRLSTKHDK